MLTQSVQFLHQIGPQILLAEKDLALLKSVIGFYSKIIGTLEKKSSASLAAELKLPDLPVDEMYNSKKQSIKNGKAKKVC